MRSRPDRLNRSLLTLLGLLLAAAGGYGLARGLDAFGRRQARQPVLFPAVRNFVSDYKDIFWPVAFVLALLLALLGLRWLISQLRSPGRLSEVDLTHPSPHGGHTSVRAPAAATALEEDLQTVDGVQGASVRLVGGRAEPRVDCRVDVVEDADLSRVRSGIEQDAFSRFRRALEIDDLQAHVRLRLDEARGRQVR